MLHPMSAPHAVRHEKIDGGSGDPRGIMLPYAPCQFKTPYRGKYVSSTLKEIDINRPRSKENGNHLKLTSTRTKQDLPRHTCFRSNHIKALERIPGQTGTDESVPADHENAFGTVSVRPGPPIRFPPVPRRARDG